MRFRAGGLAAMGMVLLALPAHAGLWWGLMGGATTPTGDGSSVFGEGYHFGLSLDWQDEERDEIGLTARYHALGEKTYASQVFGIPIGVKGRADILDIALDIRGAFGSRQARIAPYVQGGLGVDRVMSDLTLITPSGRTRVSASDTFVSVHAGAGLRWQPSEATGVRFEAQFHRTFPDVGDPLDMLSFGLSVHAREDP